MYYTSVSSHVRSAWSVMAKTHRNIRRALLLLKAASIISVFTWSNELVGSGEGGVKGDRE